MNFLEKQQSQLEVCEKALADYMESKRRAFPRFYFVSTADLLDILSNGNNPIKVMVSAHLQHTVLYQVETRSQLTPCCLVISMSIPTSQAPSCRSCNTCPNVSKLLKS